MATIMEIAKRAGVSKTTVSRYINGEARGHISPDTQKRIQKAIDDLDYRPNDVARSLKRKTTDVVGVIVNDISNIFFLPMLKGIEEVLQKAGYQMMICNSNMSTEQETELVRMLLQKQISGLIIIGMNMDVTHIADMNVNVPVVLFERSADGTPYDSVMIDDELGVRMAVEHLLESGRRRIAHIAGSAKSEISRKRSEIFLKVMREHGRIPEDQYLVQGDYSMEQAYQAMAGLCRLPSPPDAVFCSNDLMAVGAMKYLLEHSCRIPEQMAIVGYDDIDAASLVTPALTTVRQPVLELAQKGAEMLLKRIGKKGGPGKHLVLKPELIIRKTT
ncbi:MAG TPA: LacI family DNA-binding transcriptional regulator [Candidatus Scatomonas merdigallinarum]|nr:LacI family DNA-binding transcriptional regulator [Candidatus Scatomonas merdigallinarum]